MTTQLRSWAQALCGDVSGNGVICPGPGHSARDRSLSVTPSVTAPSGFLVHSFAGDDPIACLDYVRARLGLPEFSPEQPRKPLGGQSEPADYMDRGEPKKGASELPCAPYDPKAAFEFIYHDESGAVLYRVKRTDHKGGKRGKSFFQNPPDPNSPGRWLTGKGCMDGVRRVPYHLLELLEAFRQGETVLIVEGERKTDLLRHWGFAATCNSGGRGSANVWAEHAREFFLSYYTSGIIILPDHDDAGREHAGIVAEAFASVGATVRILALPGLGPQGDVVDWVEAGGTAEQLHVLIDRDARPWVSGDTLSVSAEEPAPDNKPPVVLHAFNPADWEGKKAPPRKSIVPDYIPDETVTLLYADGGTGKSYLKLQLAVARALAKEWIGLLPIPGRTLVLSTEDDLDEMWRRIEGMLPFFGARMADLGDIRLIDLVGENSVLGLLTKGIIEPTPMYDALDRYMADFKPGLVELDVLADLFSGEENNRPQVTQFVGLLKRLCRKHHCAILLLAQPSVAGMNTGSGTSGSTGWSNSGRSRLYFQKVNASDGAELNKNLRTFEGKKANYSEVGGKFDVEWKDGLFRRAIGPTGFAKMAAMQKAEDLFLSQLASFAKSGRSVSDSPGANYAPTKFASDKPTQELLKLAMFRLFDKGTIKIEPGGSPSRPTKRIVLA